MKKNIYVFKRISSGICQMFKVAQTAMRRLLSMLKISWLRSSPQYLSRGCFRGKFRVLSRRWELCAFVDMSWRDYPKRWYSWIVFCSMQFPLSALTGSLDLCMWMQVWIHRTPALQLTGVNMHKRRRISLIIIHPQPGSWRRWLRAIKVKI